LKNEDSSDEYAKLQAFFSFIQTFGSLLTGFILDRFTPKIGFVVSFTASALSYFLLSHSTSLSILYMSKIPTIFQAGFVSRLIIYT
jgi:sugar phosphate permease